ncbi:G-protein coupled receptor Mth2-like isoform X6 [Schistocerca gregaria]|uniref:G-protein coupled receptor Mth2-like isoform X6 n=1 Tax=Schistocerca gregaria TaxID=7010 RepID=UPI00211DCC92|nr:G-protein coupled receptor Mth2-like isoform X6 [Schistocerca gregaria]
MYSDALLLLLLAATCSVGQCLHRCCPRGAWLDQSAADCFSAPDNASADFRPALHYRHRNGSYAPAENASVPVSDEHPCPEGYYPLEPEMDPAEEHYVLTTGELHFPADGSVLGPAAFCLAEVFPDGRVRTYVCESAVDVPFVVPASFALYGGLMLVSSLFVLATFFVYASVRRLRNVSGLCLMSYTAVLFVGYVASGTSQIFDVADGAPCFAAAFIIYFSFLASFFWLNVMCFDIFWTFSGFRSLRGTAREREHKKFIIYSIYSWGCPLILLSVTLVMQFHNDIPDGLLRPQFGVKRCWFPDDITILAYFYGPVGVLVLCNIILFILTAIRIAQLKRETAMLKGTDSRRHDDDNRQRFNLYLKLFLVMGVNWSMEVISGLVGGPEYVWYVTDICNTLQGVLIFVIFVWKDRIRRMLMEKFCPKRASTKLSKSTVVTYSTRASPSRLSHGVLNNKVTDNSNGDVVKITAITPISDDSDVP